MTLDGRFHDSAETKKYPRETRKLCLSFHDENDNKYLPGNMNMYGCLLRAFVLICFRQTALSLWRFFWFSVWFVLVWIFKTEFLP